MEQTDIGLLPQLKRWWREIRARAEEERNQDRNRAIDREMQQRVTITHFNGHIFVAFDGVPLVKCDTAEAALDNMREMRHNLGIWRISTNLKANVF